MIEGLSHVTFVVRDLERMASFLETILDARQVYSSGDGTHSISRERFFLVGSVWLAIMEGEPLPDKSYNHVAFKIPDHEFAEYEQRIRAMGLEFRVSRSRMEGEGRSLYFHDYDNHLFELHTGTLSERLLTYRSAGE
jgi:catechol 2,3-dioxygenase-like lactoylglutathione lyase family enzyme